jgi:hypothetical protein
VAVTLRLRLLLTVAALGVAAMSATAASAQSTVQVAHAGVVTATFSFGGSVFSGYSGETLQITRDGILAYSANVTAPTCGGGCAPGSTQDLESSSVHVVGLEGPGEPDVVLDLFTGGAHCCYYEEVFYYDATLRTYHRATLNFLDQVASFRDLGHKQKLELITADHRHFDYRFTDYADCGFPILVYAFKGGSFVDVTRQYPKLIAGDAALWWREFRLSGQQQDMYRNSVGLIAAWAADEDLLGHEAQVSSTLATQQRDGHLNGPLESGTKFIKDLLKVLRRDGYSH